MLCCLVRVVSAACGTRRYKGCKDLACAQWLPAFSPAQLPVPALRTLCQVQPAERQLWVGAGGHRYKHMWGLHIQGMHRTAQKQPCAGKSRHGHTDPGTHRYVHGYMHTNTCEHTCLGSALPHAHVYTHTCSQGLHLQRAPTDLGKHPPYAMCQPQQGADSHACHPR